MSFATDKWFKHLREEILTEGIGDIGLSADNVNRIRMEMHDASEKDSYFLVILFQFAQENGDSLSIK